MNALAVVDYATSGEPVNVDHIVVVGHTACGAVRAALKIAEVDEGQPEPYCNHPPVQQWLESLIKLAKEVVAEDVPGQIIIPLT